MFTSYQQHLTALCQQRQSKIICQVTSSVKPEMSHQPRISKSQEHKRGIRFNHFTLMAMKLTLVSNFQIYEQNCNNLGIL